MKILFVDNGILRDIKEKIDINEFLKENKMVIFSQYPYLSEPSDITYVLQNEKIYGSSLDSIMFIANGKLADFFIRGDDEKNTKYIKSDYGIVSNDKIYSVISNYGPNLSEEDLFMFPINYYSKKYGCNELEILFFSKNHFYKRHNFDVGKLWETYRNLICENEFSDNLNHFHTIKLSPESQLEDKSNGQMKKIIFCDAEGIFYNAISDYCIDGIKCSLEKYLNQGNFLALFCETGNHYGELFRLDKAPDHDTIVNQNMHRYITDYFKSLSIDPNQVYSFKTGSVGFNFECGSCNIGFSNMAFSSRKNLSDLHIKYLRKLGYNIDQVNFLTYPMNAWATSGWLNQQDDLKLFAEKNNGIYQVLKNQEDFNEAVLKKILKR